MLCLQGYSLSTGRSLDTGTKKCILCPSSCLDCDTTLLSEKGESTACKKCAAGHYLTSEDKQCKQCTLPQNCVKVVATPDGTRCRCETCARGYPWVDSDPGV